MDAFASVLGKGTSGIANNLDAPRPSDLARRKLEDACRGLGSGIPSHALKALQENEKTLDRPLLVELREKLASSLLTRVSEQQATSLRFLLDLSGIKSHIASYLGAEPGSADVPIVHILSSPIDMTEPKTNLDGHATVCGLTLTEKSGAVERGSFKSAQILYKRPYYHFKACSDCAEHVDEYADATESVEYPIFDENKTDAFTSLSQENLDAAILENLAALSSEETIELALAAFDKAFLEVASKAAHEKPDIVHCALKEAYPILATTITDEHGLHETPQDLAPDQDEWREILSEYLSLVKVKGNEKSIAVSNWEGLMKLPESLAQTILNKASAISGKPAVLPLLPGQQPREIMQKEKKKDDAEAKRKKIKSKVQHT